MASGVPAGEGSVEGDAIGLALCDGEAAVEGLDVGGLFAVSVEVVHATVARSMPTSSAAGLHIAVILVVRSLKQGAADSGQQANSMSTFRSASFDRWVVAQAAVSTRARRTVPTYDVTHPLP